MRKNRKPREEKYPLVEEWYDAPEQYQTVPLREGEYTIMVDPNTGMGICLIARSKTLKFHSYVDGFQFRENLKKVSPKELRERAKEREKFL